MRLSSDKDDPGYRDWCIVRSDMKTIKVFLDGVEQNRCEMADDEAGEIRRFVTTPQGNLATDMIRGEFLTEVVKGKVEICIEDRA